VGKSLIAKAAGNELGLPTLMVHPGNWMGSLVGESEARTRKGFQIIRAHAPCVAVVDEVEKVMPKSRGHQGDGGVGARMEGSFLTAMNDIVEPVFWVFTANDVKNMHEAFFRAERIDASFYVKLPTADARAIVWRLYLKKFFPAEVDGAPFSAHLSLDFNDLLAQYGRAKKPDVSAWARKMAACLQALGEEEREAAAGRVPEGDLRTSVKKMVVDDEGWTPAEIRACCRLSRLLEQPLAKTARMIRPVSVSAAGVIDKLEEWATEAALDAETGEVYAGVPSAEEDEEDEGRGHRRAAASEKTRVRRKVRRVE
jgi:SpoVK/Ycf46/Vps4 family AAA+-type ATPase